MVFSIFIRTSKIIIFNHLPPASESECKNIKSYWRKTMDNIKKIVFLHHFFRGVAQLASVLAWGARGRKFESSHPDEKKPDNQRVASLLKSQVSKMSVQLFIVAKKK